MNCAAALLLASMLSASGAGGDHLLAGARHFREGRYGEALVEFRVADSLGADGARAYAAASLVELERFDEAVEAFEGVPGGQDTLLDYYRALACFGAHLYTCAETILNAIGDHGGPKIAAEVAALRREIQAQRDRPSADSDIAWYAARCAELRVQKRPALASLFCRESSVLESRSAAASRTSRTRSPPPLSTGAPP